MGVSSILIGVLLAAQAASGQVLTGIPPFSSATPSTFDTVDNANLNVHFAIPIFSRAGRVLPFSYVLSYDSSIWQPLASAWYPNVLNWGWRGTAGALMGYANYSHTINGCYISQGRYSYDEYSLWMYQDAQGALHYFNIQVSDGQSTPCSGVPPYSQTAAATDGSGWTMTATAAPSATVTSPSGVVIVPPLTTDDPTSGLGSITDTNGNEIYGTFSTTSNTFYDTLSSTPALTVDTSGAPSLIKYTYTGPSGSAVSFQVSYAQKNVQTNFGCSGIAEYGPTQQYLVKEIDLPDNSSKYTFTYETTPSHSPNVTGRLASVTLPTGGEITYAYSGGSNGVVCADGSTATLTRTVSPGGIWSYAHTESGSAWTTTITDPQSDQTVMNFQGVYETERQVNQGTSTLLETVNTCYNGASGNCNSTAITLPITRRTATVTLGNMESENDAYYKSSGLVAKVDEYDFGNGSVGAMKRETMTCYQSFSNNPNILDRPQYSLVYTATGNPSDCSGTSNLAAKTTFTYDGNDNPQTETHTNTGGSPASISRTFTYNTNGTLGAATDFDSSSNKTSYTYGSGSCNGAFPTTVSVPMSLSISIAWNCNGGVPTSITDVNGQTTSFNYDSVNNFWRVTEIDYPDGGKDKTAYTDTQGAFTVANSRLVSKRRLPYCHRVAGRSRAYS